MQIQLRARAIVCVCVCVCVNEVRRLSSWHLLQTDSRLHARWTIGVSGERNIMKMY
jgi:hypothetical protein